MFLLALPDRENDGNYFLLGAMAMTSTKPVVSDVYASSPVDSEVYARLLVKKRQFHKPTFLRSLQTTTLILTDGFFQILKFVSNNHADVIF